MRLRENSADAALGISGVDTDLFTANTEERQYGFLIIA
jgi:hypothetical protein